MAGHGRGRVLAMCVGREARSGNLSKLVAIGYMRGDDLKSHSASEESGRLPQLANDTGVEPAETSERAARGLSTTCTVTTLP